MSATRHHRSRKTRITGPKLTVLGAAGEVTGSRYLVETGTVRFIVDCGMFQGGGAPDRKNRAQFGFDPHALDFVLLTHAHIDHSGLLPRLAAEGFSKPIYATQATCDLLEVMLTDSAHIQEKEAEWRTKSRKRRGAGSPPLYTTTDAIRALKLLKPVEYETEVQPGTGIRCTFHDAGHILGSAIVDVRLHDSGRERRVVFSGDLGQPSRPLVRDPAPIESADVLLVESTYGNRAHKSLDDTVKELEEAITDTISRRGGNVIVPAFAVGRTQELLYLLAQLARAGRLPPVDIYVDSPMALKATEITLRHTRILDRESGELIAWLRNGANGPRIRFVQDLEESIGLHRIRSGALIISASGMCDAGRIKHHLRHNLGRSECSILITGFQAAGTLGRRIVDGAREVRIFGIPIPVRARVYTIGGLSAHADQQGLLNWLAHFRKAPRQTLVVHGEQETAEIFAQVVQDRLHWTAVTVATPHAQVEI